MKLTLAWQQYTQKIVLHCLVVTTPMLVSSLVILYIVYANLVTPSCASKELCPATGLVNTTSRAFYYIDFPAAQLAFVSSWSATVSFALDGFLMAFASYANANALLRASEGGEQDDLPTPHQMSVLLRVLNAKMMVLWDLAIMKVKNVFWHRETEAETVKCSSPILNTNVVVLLVSIVTSLLVQVVDVYFHIAAEAVQLVQVQDIPSVSRQYSREIAPWCLNRPANGPLGPTSFWGCAITAQAALNNGTSLAPTNTTTIQDMKNSVSDQHETLNFTNADGIQYAVVGPPNADPAEDYQATTFGVSTSCAAIPENGCEVAPPITNVKDGVGSPVMLVPFACSKNSSGISITESSPFLINFMETPNGLSNFEINTAIEKETADEMFYNPWSVLALRKLPFAQQADFERLPRPFRNDTRIWKHGLLGAFALMVCNVTVWDMTYTKAGGQITSLTKFPSNGSTAGMASLPGTRFIGTLTNVFQDLSTGPESRSSPSAFIRAFEIGMSKAYSFPLASQLSSRASLAAQVRSSKVVTRLPVAALWTLVVANVGFAVLGLGLAVWAMRLASPDVHQTQMRLGVAGLAAALFDREKFEQSVSADDGLFAEKSGEGTVDVKRIGFKRTETGGSTFAVYDAGFRLAEAKEMRKRYFSSIVG
ncbi:hypothetical protein P171DRAFT_487485 [Karstenula rhodostoma CBS 690.94]|uniref:Uncharacterized protein n=1 Tax=Karstenula rhodostoma CBS 690.94 TaxID=1392251 RepID=A0A9P4U9J5_9PLEO|nr:hypothetical protein P171DRAFT_487485 [Karstenula rhodostoma CBS 690.94]